MLFRSDWSVDFMVMGRTPSHKPHQGTLDSGDLDLLCTIRTCQTLSSAQGKTKLSPKPRRTEMQNLSPHRGNVNDCMLYKCKCLLLALERSPVFSLLYQSHTTSALGFHWLHRDHLPAFSLGAASRPTRTLTCVSLSWHILIRTRMTFPFHFERCADASLLAVHLH